MPFKAFYNDWLDCSGMIAETGELSVVNLDAAFFNNLKFDEQSLKKYRIDAAIRCAETLGPNPALLLSGGIDSQAMVLCWQEAGLEFDVIIGVFKDGLNKHDVDDARMFCESSGIPYKELDINITKFLASENYFFSQKYKSYSPHFNTHYKMVELLSAQGYTGACFGGATVFKHNGNFGQNFMGMPFHFLKIQHLLPIPMQGSFLSFSPELCWVIGLQGREISYTLKGDEGRIIVDQNLLDRINDLRYKEKISSYLNSGLKITPQKQKFTGFELVKEYYAKKYDNGWTFENFFRYRIAEEFQTDHNVYDKFKFKEGVLSLIESIHSNNV